MSRQMRRIEVVARKQIPDIIQTRIPYPKTHIHVSGSYNLPYLTGTNLAPRVFSLFDMKNSKKKNLSSRRPLYQKPRKLWGRDR